MKAVSVAICLLIVMLGTYVSAADHAPVTAIVINCVDPRYEQPEFVEKLPHGYHFTGAGASLCVLDDEHFRASLDRQVTLLRKAGAHIETVYIVDHSTCKAYGTHDLNSTHEQKLRAAAQVLRADEHFKDCNFILRLHDMEKNKLIVVEEEPAQTMP